MGGGASKYKGELETLRAAQKAKEKLLAELHKKHEHKTQEHLSTVAQNAALHLELNHERERRARLEEEVGLLRRRCGAATHGAPESDVRERRTVIAELEALDAAGPLKPVVAMVAAKLKKEIAEIERRVPDAREG